MIELIEAESLRPAGGGSPLFEGADHGGMDVSFFINRTPPGLGPSLHVHPYAEVFVVEVGELTFTVGGETIRAVAGQVVVAPGGRPHKFVNSGAETSWMTSIHPVGRTETEWLLSE